MSICSIEINPVLPFAKVVSYSKLTQIALRLFGCRGVRAKKGEYETMSRRNAGREVSAEASITFTLISTSKKAATPGNASSPVLWKL